MNQAMTDTDELQNVLEAMKRDLPSLAQDCESVAERLYETVDPETWSRIGDLVERMDQLYRRADLISRVLADLTDYEELQTVAETFVREFAGKFRTMNDCMDREEYRDAADCLKYELVDQLRGLARALGDEIEVMDARYRKNLDYLQRTFPAVYQEIAGVEPDWLNYQIVYARTGMPNLKIRTEDNRWIKFYSHYDPEAETARWGAKLKGELGETADMILYGLGFGYHLLLLSLHIPNLRISIYEPNKQIFIAAMHAVDLESLFARVRVIDLLVGGDTMRRERLVFNFMKMSGSNPSVQALPIYGRLDPSGMLEFRDDAKTASMTYASSITTYGKFAYDWLRNRMFNLPAILNSPSIRNFKGALAGRTAVIVGAGPSLEPEIPVLRELKKHAVIIAAGSTIQSLMHYGIEPHALAVIDGGEVNYAIYDHISIRHIPLLFGPMAHYWVVDSHDADKLIHFYLKEDYLSHYLIGLGDDDPIFDLVPSVTGNAIEAAIYMGCTEIVLVGQDLSYPASQIYSPGAKHVTEQDQKRIIETAKYTVENVNGGVNQATHGLYVTLKHLEALLRQYPNIPFTNTSRYGAKIKHTRWEPLESVLERLKGHEVPEDAIGRLLGAPENLYDEQRRAQARARLTHLPVQIDEFEKWLKRIREKLDQLPKLSRKHTNRCLQYMREIELDWVRVTSSVPFITFCTALNMADIRAFDRDRPELERETRIERKARLFVEILGPIAEALQSSVPKMRRLTDRAIERIKD